MEQSTNEKTSNKHNVLCAGGVIPQILPQTSQCAQIVQNLHVQQQAQQQLHMRQQMDNGQNQNHDPQSKSKMPLKQQLILQQDANPQIHNAIEIMLLSSLLSNPSQPQYTSQAQQNQNSNSQQLQQFVNAKTVTISNYNLFNYHLNNVNNNNNINNINLQQSHTPSTLSPIKNEYENNNHHNIFQPLQTLQQGTQSVQKPASNGLPQPLMQHHPFASNYGIMSALALLGSNLNAIIPPCSNTSNNGHNVSKTATTGYMNNIVNTNTSNTANCNDGHNMYSMNKNNTSNDSNNISNNNMYKRCNVTSHNTTLPTSNLGMSRAFLYVFVLYFYVHLFRHN